MISLYSDLEGQATMYQYIIQHVLTGENHGTFATAEAALAQADIYRASGFHFFQIIRVKA